MKPICSKRATSLVLVLCSDHFYGKLADYRHLLIDWKTEYAPKQPGDDFHPHFVEALTKLPQVENDLDVLWSGDPKSKRMIIEELMKHEEKEVETLNTADMVGSWIEMAKEEDHVRLMVDTAEKMYSKAYLEKNRKLFPLMARFTKPRSYERFFRNAYAIIKFGAREELSKICCPTLIIAGDDDNTVGNDAPYELNAGIPNSTMFIYKGLGHSAFEEAKDFYDKAYEFCESGRILQG